MTIDEFKKIKITAMKEKDKDAVDIYNIIISKLMLVNIEKKAQNAEMTEADCANVLKKVEKELIEERDGFVKAGREETVASLDRQLEIVRKYLPKMLSEEEIKNIIMTLEDKQIGSVMRYFKTNYNGQVDMKLIGEVLKTING